MKLKNACLRNVFWPLAALALLAACKSLSLSERAAMGRSPAEIRKNGILHVAVHSDIPKMGLRDTATGEYTGYEIEIARMLARDMLSSSSFKRKNSLDFIPVTSENRDTVVQSGEADLMIATFSTNDPSAMMYNLSPPYYTDYAGLMVRKDSGLVGLSSMNGRSIGVIRGTATREAIEEAARVIGVAPRFYEFVRFSEIKAALDSGLLDVFAADKTVLSRYLDGNTTILHDTFAPREYSIVVKRSNVDLASFISQWVTQRAQENIFSSLKAREGLE